MRQTGYRGTRAGIFALLAFMACAGTSAAQDVARPTDKPAEASKTPETWLPKLRVGDDNAYMEVYGQINKGLLIYDDGGSSENYFPADNGNSSSRIGFRIYSLMEDNWSVGLNAEWEWNPYSTTNVNQLNKDDFDWETHLLRKAEVYLDSKEYGKFWFGQGSMASDETAEVDLSGTSVVGYSLISDMAGGPFFRLSDGSLSTVHVKDAFTNYDGLSRKLRVRYDTPSLGGFSLATSVGTQVVPDTTDVAVWDVALRYDETFEEFKVGGAVAFSRPGDGNSTYDASISVLHLSTGLSLTLATGYADKQAVDGRYGYVKVGYQTDIFDIGKTAFSLDAYFGKDIAGEDSRSDSYGAQVVQNVDYLRTEIYLGARTYSYEKEAMDVEDSFAVLAGARLKF